MSLAMPALDRLRDAAGGQVILPGDDDYDSARRVWNAKFDRRPAAIVRPTTVAGVVASVRFAREHDLQIAVRGGGHSAAGHSTCDDGLLIDLAGLRGVTVDPAIRTARANGGALLSELDKAGQAHGLVCPVGVIGHTGVGGLTLGGGMGRLQRKFGFTIDNLLAVELVTADGAIVRASADQHPDLFWGIRGAGWNFGVVTAFEFELQPFAGMLNRSLRIYPASDVHDLWAIARELPATLADEVSMTFNVVRAEPAADYPEALAGKPAVIVGLNHCGDPAAVDRDLAPLLAGPEPLVASVARTSYLEIQGASDDAMGWGKRSYIKGAFADDIRPEAFDAMLEHVADAPGEASFSLTVGGGALWCVPEASTAFAGRGARFEMSADAGAWDDPAEDDRYIGWVRAAMAIVEPDAVVGRYVNEMAESSPEESRLIYGDAGFARLAELKRAWDPDNAFRLNHNVPPAA
jgi:FAD/FMN-containing dehydrogenase